MSCSTQSSKACSALHSPWTHRALLPHPTNSLGAKIRPHFAEPRGVCQGQFGGGCLYPNHLHTPSQWSATSPSTLHIVVRHGPHTLSREASRWKTSLCLYNHAYSRVLMTTYETKRSISAMTSESVDVSRCQSRKIRRILSNALNCGNSQNMLLDDSSATARWWSPPRALRMYNKLWRRRTCLPFALRSFGLDDIRIRARIVPPHAMNYDQGNRYASLLCHVKSYQRTSISSKAQAQVTPPPPCTRAHTSTK
jgi:hypothetical protein